jgi:integrase
MPLTDTAIKNAKPKAKSYKLPDGGGLYLYISTTGAKLFRYKYRIAGREGIYSIGEYPETSLAKAREEHLKARELVKHSTHPTHDRQLKKLVAHHETGNTFKAIATEWLNKNAGRWAPSSLRNTKRVIENDVLPKIGALPIKQVTAAHILAIMQCAESRGSVTVAILVRRWCSAIFRYAAASLRVDTDPAAALKGVVIRKKVKHNRPLSSKEIPELLTALKKLGGVQSTRIAIELLLLTFVRTGELRQATWHEIDLDKAVWRIPPQRMKMKTEHIVPLSTQVVALFTKLKGITGEHGWLFPNQMGMPGMLI